MTAFQLCVWRYEVLVVSELSSLNKILNLKYKGV